jgi:hypothetical protein
MSSSNSHNQTTIPTLTLSDDASISPLILPTPLSFSPEITAFEHIKTIDLAKAAHDIHIFNAFNKMRLDRLEHTRVPDAPILIDLQIKILINSAPILTNPDSRVQTQTVKAEDYQQYTKLGARIHSEVEALWRHADMARDKYPEQVNEDFGNADEAWKNKFKKEGGLLSTQPRARLKLEEDGNAAEHSIAGTVIRGDEDEYVKGTTYQGWYERNVRRGRLGRYVLEYTLDVVA